ncbi:MAG TPA: DMT family transporter [Kofleriaceae bacterium]|nr:DMT family transporter [Kofleriaceae bacterium]
MTTTNDAVAPSDTDGERRGLEGRIVLFTAAALVGFAANSVLCRLALRGGERGVQIDAASYTAVRLVSGAAVLLLLAWPRSSGSRTMSASRGSWASALALFAYAAPFSFAYVRVNTGVGALVLFGCVQTTMLAWAIARGERPRPRVWLGLAIAAGGLVALARPGGGAPDAAGTAVMAVAGAAWGVYSIRGKGVANPLAATSGNFVRTVPMVVVLVTIVATSGAFALHASLRGVLLAVASGAIASGLGYTCWYTALRGLTATRAAILQLLVPLLAAAAGVLLLGEDVSPRLLIAAAAITGGVALAIRGRS